jgi:hypothetical protein
MLGRGKLQQYDAAHVEEENAQGIVADVVGHGAE